jgi:tetratricopeptide (TPR) repeat protein
VHCIAYPPQWELKRSLADRYAKLGVYGSAAEMYTELEAWDEVVQCYRALERPNRAEEIVRERLKVLETPAMWTALGDLTQDAECYNKAWALSKGRYARAKRSLGRLAFRNKKYVPMSTSVTLCMQGVELRAV